MKRSGILNPAIAHLLASTGHTDYFTICDQGFPVPMEPERIDVAVVTGLPTVTDILKAIHGEFIIDQMLIAEEALAFSPKYVESLRGLLGELPIITVSHLELKELSHEGRATIRNGDATPYANILVVSE